MIFMSVYMCICVYFLNLTMTIGMPFEVWKTHMAANRTQTTVQAFRAIYEKGGPKAFWAGTSAKVCGSMRIAFFLSLSTAEGSYTGRLRSTCTTLYTWLTDLTYGILVLGVSQCAMCTFSKVSHPHVLSFANVVL